jgi:uncharacterized protein
MRDQALDATRSVSHFGIIAANMPFFALPGGYGLSWWLNGAGSADMAATFFIRAFCEGPFIGLFTMLFGFGVAQQLAVQGQAFVLRRALLIGIMGMFHGLLLFGGDILLAYALCAVAFTFLRRRIQNILGAVVVSICLSVLGLFALSALQFLIEIPRPDGVGILTVMQSGSWQEILLLNVQGWVGFYAALPFHLFFFIFGSFILGVWVFEKLGNMLTAAKALREWSKPLWIAGLIGSGVYSGLMLLGQLHQTPALEFLAAPLRPLFGFILMLPLFSWLYLLMNANHEHPVVRLFSVTGRASLSLYVAQSVIGVVVFSGLGLFATLPMSAVLGFSFAVLIALQLLMALWLRFYANGPLETVMKLLVARKPRHSNA